MSEILSGKKEICDFLRVGKERFKDLIKKGAPIRRDGLKYVAKRQQLSEWYFNSLPENCG